MYGMMSKDIRAHHVEKSLGEAQAAKEWLPFATAAIDAPAAELFLKLRSGQIETTGKLLPDGAEIIDFLEQDNSYGRNDFDHLVDSAIPQEFWTMRGIDWVSNSVMAHGNCYCDVSMSVEALMTLFPGEHTPVGEVEFVGDFCASKNFQQTTGRSIRDERRDALPRSHGTLCTLRSRT